MGSEAVTAALPGLGLRPDVCLIAEPTDLALCRSLRGFTVVRVTFTGRAAHSSQAEQGINAVTHLGRFLHAVDERAPSIRAAGGELMVTVVHGGGSPFVVPDRDGWRLGHDGPAAELAAGLGAQLGTGPTFDAPYWMEAPLWQAVCPTLVCEPARGGLHAVDECVDLAQVRALASALVIVLAAWLPDSTCHGD